SFVEDGNLTQYIYVLRKVLGQAPNGQSYIETVPKQGYRFTLQPHQISVINNSLKSPHITAENFYNPIFTETDQKIHLSDDSQFRVDLTAGFDDLDKDDFTVNKLDKSSSFISNTFGKLGSPHSKIAGGAAVLFLFVGLAIGTATVYFLQNDSKQKAEVAQIKSIAVMPFKPIGEEVDKEKLGLGMTDAVISRLGKSRQIVVRPTSSVSRFTKKRANIREIGRELGVDAVLEGTTQCDGERVRVSVQLVRVSDEKSVWAGSFQEKISDIFDAQDAISEKVAATLSTDLTKQQEQTVESLPAKNPEVDEAEQK
ncbi:MAG TPA: winged helix-turn-helix domain-containing protein, partial [Pyrinomonadaceae bacterium]